MGGAGALMTGQRASSEDKGYFTMADVAQRRDVETKISSRMEHFIKTLSAISDAGTEKRRILETCSPETCSPVWR